ncbi:MAG TPA: ABC transporter ATP-binding protein [Polyangiaceae bacterium]|nr:ABC transporter ATP-binding protein [Polyangiaceae bacterium]
MPTALEVRGLSKQYVLGGASKRYGTLRESLVDAAKAPLKLFAKETKQKTLWAVKDVTFDVQQGEVVGIIGRNGAGKSTLLKLISRITEPTRGEVDLYGRVGSLLEVGTGFHPELTGYENIFLSGAILGMRRHEIRRKLDEIVAFADVEKFLDTPIKRYSSGMYTRLAFAVAAHLEPEILVVDEVLAVGDANFQKKCLGKLGELSGSGRTVLFVSHSMANVLRLCGRVLLLENGTLIEDGVPEQVTKRYLQSDSGSPTERVWPTPADAPGNSVARLHAVRVLNREGEVAESIDIREELAIEVEYWNLQTTLRPTVSLWLTNEDGTTIFVSNDFNDRNWYRTTREPGRVRARVTIPGNFLADGTYFVLAGVATYNPDIAHVFERDVVAFQIVDRSTGDGVRGDFTGRWPGVVRPMLDWKIAAQPDVLVDEHLGRMTEERR